MQKGENNSEKKCAKQQIISDIEKKQAKQEKKKKRFARNVRAVLAVGWPLYKPLSSHTAQSVLLRDRVETSWNTETTTGGCERGLLATHDRAKQKKEREKKKRSNSMVRW